MLLPNYSNHGLNITRNHSLLVVLISSLHYIWHNSTNREVVINNSLFNESAVCWFWFLLCEEKSGDDGIEAIFNLEIFPFPIGWCIIIQAICPEIKETHNNGLDNAFCHT